MAELQFQLLAIVRLLQSFKRCGTRISCSMLEWDDVPSFSTRWRRMAASCLGGQVDNVDQMEGRQEERLKNLLSHLTGDKDHYESLLVQDQFVSCVDGNVARILNEMLDPNFDLNQISMASLCTLSKRGHLWGRDNETIESYSNRVLAQYRMLLYLERTTLRLGTERVIRQYDGNDLSQMGSGMTTPMQHDVIPLAHIQQAVHTLQDRFDMNMLCVPGFYVPFSDLPSLTGACSYFTNVGCFILLHDALRLSDRTRTAGNLVRLDRAELIQHELIHAARAGLESVRFEEEFAYSTSSSQLRQALAPITQNPSDATTFVATSLLSMFSDLPVFSRRFSLVGKLPMLGVTASALGRLMLTKRAMRHATKCLQHVQATGSNHTVSRILIRLTDEDINALAQLWRRIRRMDPQVMTDEINRFILQMSSHNMRWGIVYKLFHFE